MTWHLTAKGKAVSPIPEIPWRDLTDAEFEAASRLMDEQFPGDPGSLKRSGFFAKARVKEGEVTDASS